MAKDKLKLLNKTAKTKKKRRERVKKQIQQLLKRLHRKLLLKLHHQRLQLKTRLYRILRKRKKKNYPLF